MTRTLSSTLSGIVLIAAIACGSNVLLAQESTAPTDQAPTPSSPSAPACVEPPMLRLSDYNGPLKKTVGLFTRDLGRKEVQPSAYARGSTLCSFTPKAKFLLFIRDSVDPVTFLAAGFFSGLAAAGNLDPSFGEGPAGYGKRYAAAYADQVSFKFFKDFAYPSLFGEDPRHYRRVGGSTRTRLLYAAGHVIIARHENGGHMFNYSEWLGTASTVALSNLYHPGNERGFAPAAETVGINILIDVGLDELREFLPEISRTLRLPFVVEPESRNPALNPPRR